MIRKMRWKVVGVTMAVVTAVLLVALVSVFFASRAALESRTREQLQQALQGDAFSPWRPGQETASPGAYFTVEVYAGGTVRIVDSGFINMDDEEMILAIVNNCLSRQEDYGSLPDYNLRYLRSASALNVRIAFADSTLERQTIRSMVGTTVLTGILAFVALFGASYLLSGLVTRPVEQAWREQQRFLSDASHELKTPLTVILSSADLLSETAIEGEQAVYIENIRIESRRMKKLVESMLTLSRADDGEHKLVFSTVDWSDVVTDTALRFEPVAFEANRELRYNIEENLSVTGDGERLGQLTAILLDNAIKYAPAGDPIRLSLTKDGASARLTVENGGTPIPPEVRAHLFDRFYRADSARSGSEGFGLGLSIAQSIAAQHHGTIRCESDQRSTRFIVTLPLKR